jgi:hypothetical protein
MNRRRNEQHTRKSLADFGGVFVFHGVNAPDFCAHLLVSSDAALREGRHS